ncbi:MAG: 50S ribosomal protein L21 [Eubacteriales bacterium]|nr:50S ribosomal protein L21 [Eubacteriales bacterium]
MYAIIENGSKQYKIQEGDIVFLDKIDLEDGAALILDRVVALSDEDVLTLGTPYINGLKIKAKVVGQGKGKKINIFKFKAKKNYRRRQGHRQPFTKVEILKIQIPGKAKKAEKTEQE